MSEEVGVRKRYGSWDNKSFLSTGYGLAGPVLGVEPHLGTGIAWVNDALGKRARFRDFSLRIWRRTRFFIDDHLIFK